MKQSVLPAGYADTTAKRKAELKEMSQTRMKNWPNTLEALRKKKESFTRDHEEQAEKERREIDRVEAEVRKQMRLEAIQKANDMLYNQTDKMKILKSQKLYADVLQTRTIQIEEKATRKQRIEAESKQDFENMMLKIKKGEEAEKKAFEKQKEESRLVMISRQKQLDEAKLRKEAERKEREYIGVAMRRKAEEMVEEEIRENDQKQKRIAEKNLQTIKANEELKQIREIAKEKEKAANLIIENEIAIIEERKKGRRLIEEKRFRKQQDVRQKLIDAATERLQFFENKEEERLQNEILANNEKEDREFQLRQNRQEELLKAVLENREEQLRLREQARQLEYEAELKFIQLQKESNEREALKEKEKIMREREEIRKLKQEQLLTAHERRRLREQERALKIEQEKEVKRIQDAEDEKFTLICKREIEKYAAEGKPVYTLFRALEQTQPDLMAAKVNPVDH
jgi:hypothetical protein